MKKILTHSLAKYYLPEGNINTLNLQFNKTNKDVNILNLKKNTEKLVRNFFSPINRLAGKPMILNNTSYYVIYIFYYIPKQGKIINSNTVNNLGEMLTNIIEKPVELRLIKLHYPYINSYILAQWIRINVRTYKLYKVVNRIFRTISPVKSRNSFKTMENSLPSHIVGIKVRLAGRLVTERSRPRQTVQVAELGSFSKNKLSLIDYSSYTTKNKKGAFTVKVWINQQANI